MQSIHLNQVTSGSLGAVVDEHVQLRRLHVFHDEAFVFRHFEGGARFAARSRPLPAEGEGLQNIMIRIVLNENDVLHHAIRTGSVNKECKQGHKRQEND